MPQAADQSLLHIISDHHPGLIEKAHTALDRADTSAGPRAAAEELHRKQHEETRQIHEETRQITVRLERDLGDPHEPTGTPDDQQQTVERVRQAQGAAATRTCSETAIAHHAEDLGMMAEPWPHLANPVVRRMAETMRDDQQREIDELRPQLAAC